MPFTAGSPGFDAGRGLKPVDGVNVKDDRLHRADFLTVSAIAGLQASDTYAAIDDVLVRMRAELAAITLPRLPGYRPSGEAAVTRTLAICRERVVSFA